MITWTNAHHTDPVALRSSYGTPERFLVRHQVMKYFCFIPCFSFVFILSILFIDGIDLSILGDRVHNETSDLVARELFKEFVITHNRTYVDDPMEYSERMAIFKVSTDIYKTV